MSGKKAGSTPGTAPGESAGTAKGGLRANELNLFDETVVAVSSTGPTYSLAATLSLLFVASAYAGPAVIIVSSIPMFFIAAAYFYLNSKDANCGASYAWISKVVGPHIGWFNGWIQLAASLLFCIAAPMLAASYTLQFFHAVGWSSAATAHDPWLTAGIAALWLAGITFVTVYGVRWTANAQWIFFIVQVAILMVASVWGIVKVATQHPQGSTGFHLSWLSPTSIHGVQGLAAGAVLGLFLFWGWDTAVNLNEESKAARSTPGRACIISMFVLLFIFVMNTVAVQMLVPAKQLEEQGANLLFYFAQQVGGSGLGYLMILAVLASTVGDTQTTLLPASRLSLSMARDGVYPSVFAKVQGRLHTPLIGTVILASLCLAGIFLRTASSTINNGYGNLIGDIGVLVAFYYGATGVACAWAYRKVMLTSVRFFLSGVLLPFLSGAFCFWVGDRVIAQSGLSAAAPVLVAMLLGVPLVLLAASHAHRLLPPPGDRIRVGRGVVPGVSPGRRRVVGALGCGSPDRRPKTAARCTGRLNGCLSICVRDVGPTFPAPLRPAATGSGAFADETAAPECAPPPPTPRSSPLRNGIVMARSAIVTGTSLVPGDTESSSRLIGG